MMPAMMDRISAELGTVPQAAGRDNHSGSGGATGATAPEAAEATTTRMQRFAAGAGLLVAGWLALRLFAPVLLPFVAGAGIAYFLDPLTNRLTRLGAPRTLAALLTLLALAALALAFALLLYPLIISQIGLLLARLPGYVEAIRALATTTLDSVQQRFGSEFVTTKLRDLVAGQAGAMLSMLAGAASQVIGSGFALFNVLSLLLVTPVAAFYLLRDWPRLVARIDSWLPHRYAEGIRLQAREVDRILSAWLRGQALCCVILAFYYATSLTAVGLDFGLIVGLMSGMLSFIPYVGSITGSVTAFALALGQFHSWGGVLMVAAVFVVGQTLEGYVLYPRFLGDRVELHALWVIFALLAGGAAFGFLGVLLAVPMAAVIGVLCRFWLERYLRSPLYLEGPPRPDPPREAEP